MAYGPGKYDEICTKAREETGAKVCILVIADGKFGSGFSVQMADISYQAKLPDVLRYMADQIEQQGN